MRFIQTIPYLTITISSNRYLLRLFTRSTLVKSLLTQIRITLLIILTFFSNFTLAQEYEGHLFCNPSIFHQKSNNILKSKTTASEPLQLPFFEDFNYSGPSPDSSKWIEKQVFINNTFANKPVSIGVATFDALDYRGIPYDSFSNIAFRYCDSLTSQPINLSLNVVNPGDSLYMSFIYQPQGNGFYPLLQDSLMLYMKTRFGGFVKVWSVQGSTLQPFKQVLIPINDSLFFDSSFQFRFVNIGALYWADAVWNVDYIKIDKSRSFSDTSINDIGFATPPTYLLNDYTSMPYRQFVPIPSAERVANLSVGLRNNYVATQPVSHGYFSTVINTSTVLKTLSYTPASLAPSVITTVNTPAYTTLIPLSSVGNNAKVTFRHTHVIESISTSDPPDNDTVIRDQIFDNYLAYDDGSAEKSYYLDLDPTLPGKIAIEFHLNRTDTLRGMAIYFGRQIPFPTVKMFDINIYASLAGVNGSLKDSLIHTHEYCIPGYTDTLNQFWVYKFNKPIVMPAGIFFAGVMMPAAGASDSLYFGLDVNRVGSNHAYYNVLGSWQPSLIRGAIMMRPLLGQEISGTSVQEVVTNIEKWSIKPNPANNYITLEFQGDETTQYSITSSHGALVKEGRAKNNERVDITSLTPGLYIVHMHSQNKIYRSNKFTKL